MSLVGFSVYCDELNASIRDELPKVASVFSTVERVPFTDFSESFRKCAWLRILPGLRVEISPGSLLLPSIDVGEIIITGQPLSPGLTLLMILLVHVDVRHRT